MDLKTHKTNPADETGGVEISFDADTKFKIGSTNGAAYKAAYHKELVAGQKKSRDLSREEMDGVINRLYAKHILLGWSGLTENGQPLEYSVEKAKEIMETCPTIRDFVLNQAQVNENFLADRTSAAKTNLGEN